MFNIINSAAFVQVVVVSIVPWCIGYQSEGYTNYIHFALQVGVPHIRRITMSFRYVSLYRSVPLVCSMYRLC